MMTTILIVVCVVLAIGLYLVNRRVTAVADKLNTTNRMLNEAREYIAKHDKIIKKELAK
jgi:predicted Holliday junction resolvase-like endonuclease